ncbi:MAG: hypothetical protein JJU36_15050 [Phycisphaeraceae bacterium]|nr:hypothetical protein [Phycisphaeraceae bacterium]
MKLSTLLKLSIVFLVFSSGPGWSTLPVMAGERKAPERPFVLWTAKDIATMRDKLENDPEYAARVERTLGDPIPLERHLLDLWRYVVQDDEQAGQRQKARLLQVARSPVPRGAAQWITVLRYDLLYDKLSEEERELVEDFFRTYIEHAVFRNSLFDPEVFNDERNYSRYHAHYHRIDNWLPNITFPRILSANIMAAALADEELIRRTWNHYGSWRWYFDEYLTDGGFYGEEVDKQRALPGEMLIYCIALDNLGLSELGFNYRGRHGATMRGHIESMIWLAFPKVELHSGRPHIPRMTTGDLRGGPATIRPVNLFQDVVIQGHMPDGRGGTARWLSPGAWGGEIRGNHPQWDGYTNFTPKMQIPLWFEIAHQRWPDAGFDYFLGLDRAPDQEKYQPSLYLGLDPIDPAQTRPPRAPSWVAQHRGFLMLRAEEGRGHWDSPAPAVGMRLANPYAHNVYDNFAITGFYAFNRPIYLNRHIHGYAHDWSRSVLSHAGVKVDGHEPAFTEATTVRHNFQDGLKFVAARSHELFPDIDATRGLMLTDQYLLDIFSLIGKTDQERTFRWLVHPLGHAELNEEWSQPRPMTGELGASERDQATATRHRLLAEPQKLLDTFHQARTRRMDGDWHLRVVQRTDIDPEKRALPQAWWDRKIGVDLRMAAEPGTLVLVADTPTYHHDPERRPDPAQTPGAYETGGASIIAQRQASGTLFAALHEPFEGGEGGITRFQRIDGGTMWGAWRIGGPDQSVDDRAYLRFDHHRGPITVTEDDGTEVTFADHALVRRSAGKVEIFGDVRGVRIRVGDGQTRLYFNGRLSPATIEDGIMTYRSPGG